MKKRLGVVMDAIESIHYAKDSTLAMLLEAKRRNWHIHYFTQHDVYLQNGIAYGLGCALEVYQDPVRWYQKGACETVLLADLDVILMRKDPPFNEEYIYTTYILEQAEQAGTLIVNRPRALRDANEKFFATHFPDYCPKTLVSSSITHLKAFWREEKDIVCKPLDGMGGTSVFRLRQEDPNGSVVFDTLTAKGTRFVMAQKFVPAIKDGDKRILLINGEAIPYVLARIPQGDDWRGNLAVGAEGEVRPLTARDQEIVAAVAPLLRERGLYFVGLDVIGDYLTEVNVTSPTGIRELDKALDINISAKLFDWIEASISTPS